MGQCENTPYNIPCPDSFYAGSYRELIFQVEDSGNEQIVDLTNASNINFRLSAYGDNENTLISFSRRDKVGELPRIVIDDNEKNVMTVYLYSMDTEAFVNGWYNFQIELESNTQVQNTIIGQGKIRIYAKI